MMLFVIQFWDTYTYILSFKSNLIRIKNIYTEILINDIE
jgi:hypothetical protein